MKKHFCRAVLGTFLISLCSLSAFAQTSVNSHIFRFSDTLETIQIEDALGPDSELYKHRFMLRASYDYVDQALIRLDADRNSQTGTVVDDIHSVILGGSVVLTDKLLVGISVPFHYSTVDNTQVGASDPDAWKMGDMRLKLKWRLSGDDRKVNFAVMPWGILPTGRNDAQANHYLITDDSFGYGAKLLADTTFGPVTIYANAGASYANNAEYLSIDRQFRVDTGLGGYIRFTKFLGLNVEVINAFTLSSFDKDQNPIQMLVGLRGKLGPVRAFAGLGLESLRGDRSSNESYYAGIKVPFGSRVKEEKPAPEPAPYVEPEPTISKKIQILKDNLSVRREINFETNKDVILAESYSELDSAAEVILKYQEYISTVTIEGHTDSRGRAAYNQDLSERRAKSCRRYLIGKGVPAEKLIAVGYGESRLKVEEVDAQTLRMNRRVEFVVEETIETKQELEIIEYNDGSTEQNVINETTNVVK